MSRNAIAVEILNVNDSNVEVKLPFLEVPVTMNYDFFSKRVTNGYFQVNRKDVLEKISKELYT